MVLRMSGGILRTEPRIEPSASDDNYNGVESHDGNNGESYASPPAVATDDGEDVLRGPEAWKQWIVGTIDAERAALLPFIEKRIEKRLKDLADELLDVLAPQLKTLQLQVAEMRGAVDTLRSGTPGSLRIRGTHDPAASYLLHDVVACNGSSFIAVRDGPGALPGAGWRLLASCGRRGERGQPGPRGERGMSAVAPVVPIAWHISPRNFAINLILSDGTALPPLELGKFFAEFLAQMQEAAK